MFKRIQRIRYLFRLMLGGIMNNKEFIKAAIKKS